MVDLPQPVKLIKMILHASRIRTLCFEDIPYVLHEEPLVAGRIQGCQMTGEKTRLVFIYSVGYSMRGCLSTSFLVSSVRIRSYCVPLHIKPRFRGSTNEIAA